MTNKVSKFTFDHILPEEIWAKICHDIIQIYNDYDIDKLYECDGENNYYYIDIACEERYHPLVKFFIENKIGSNYYGKHSLMYNTDIYEVVYLNVIEKDLPNSSHSRKFLNNEVRVSILNKIQEHIKKYGLNCDMS